MRTSSTARKIDSPPLDVTANDELDKLNCADNELDGLNLSHLPALCNLNRSLNRPHTFKELECSDNCHPTPDEKPDTAAERALSAA